VIVLEDIFGEWRWVVVTSIVAGVAIFIYVVHGQLFPQPEFPWEQPGTWPIISQYLFVTALISLPVIIEVVLFLVSHALEVSSEFLLLASAWNIVFVLLALQILGSFPVLSRAAINHPWESLMILGLLDFLPAWILAMYQHVSYSSTAPSDRLSMSASQSREQMPAVASHRVLARYPYSHARGYHSGLSPHWGGNSTSQNSSASGAHREDPLARFRNMGLQSPATPSVPRATHRTGTDEQDVSVPMLKKK